MSAMCECVDVSHRPDRSLCSGLRFQRPLAAQIVERATICLTGKGPLFVQAEVYPGVGWIVGENKRQVVWVDAEAP